MYLPVPLLSPLSPTHKKSLNWRTQPNNLPTITHVTCIEKTKKVYKDNMTEDAV